MNKLYSYLKPVIFAHRGASGYAPENTLAAFKKAVDLGADAIELDVKLSGDGVPVVIHDQTTDRTTNGTGDVRKYSIEQLQQLDAGGKFNAEFSNERIPTLAEVFETVGRRIYINIELTNYRSPQDGLAEKVMGVIHQYALDDWVMFSSFLPGNILSVKKRKPEIPAALLCQPGRAGALARGMIGRWVSSAVVHPYYTDMTQAFLSQEKSHGRMVNVWTVNESSEMRKLMELGVNGLITDYPDRALTLRNQA